MGLTINYLQRKFNEYNKRFFAGTLPPIKIKIGRSKKLFGYYHYRYNTYTNEIIEQYINISRYYEQTLKQYDETLIHEMIHYYIKYNKISDSSIHGHKFREIMNNINNSSDFNITITGSSYGLNSKIENDKVYRIMKFTYKNKICYAKVSNNFNVHSYSNIIKDITFFRTKDNYFSNWRTSCSRIHYNTITPERLAQITLKLAS